MTSVTDSIFHAGFNIVSYLATTTYEQMYVKSEVSYLICIYKVLGAISAHKTYPKRNKII